MGATVAWRGGRARPAPTPPVHVAFVSQFDPTDPRAYSGTAHHMAEAVRRRVERFSVVAPLRAGAPVRGRLRKLAYRARGEGYTRAQTEAGARGYAEDAEARLRALRPDVVLSPSTLPVAYLGGPWPVAFWSDATFEANLHFYGDYTNLSDEAVLEGHRVERAAMDRAALSLFATDHAARSATGYYGVDPDRVRVALYGANLAPAPDREAVERAVAARARDRCRLLFVGAGWVRKGGDVAVRVAEEVAARGVPAELVVAGTEPLLERPSPHVRTVGFVAKSTAAGRAAFDRLFLESHFLCMPVRAEDFGCVFAEAAAYGVPSLATAVGGMPSTVADAGLLFPLHERPQAIAERAVALWRDADAYAAAALRARDRFERHLNWDAAADRVVGLLREIA